MPHLCVPNHPPEDGTYWFRAVGKVRSRSYDPYSEAWFDVTPTVDILIEAYRVIKVTPKGVRVEDWDGRGRFVLRDANKRFACPTRAEAVESLLARTNRRVGILTAHLRDTKLLQQHLKAQGTPT